MQNRISITQIKKDKQRFSIVEKQSNSLQPGRLYIW
uniref:Uncharacterized protein n=1 Tax=Rhizophora mucronata TaxID=61149 RepID=A0A2P2Q5N8_RHIMU